MYEPEVARRIRMIQEAKAKGEPLDKNAEDRRNDLMQWLVEQSVHSNDPAEMDSRNLANKLVLFNLFGKIQSVRPPHNRSNLISQQPTL